MDTKLSHLFRYHKNECPCSVCLFLADGFRIRLSSKLLVISLREKIKSCILVSGETMQSIIWLIGNSHHSKTRVGTDLFATVSLWFTRAANYGITEPVRLEWNSGDLHSNLLLKARSALRSDQVAQGFVQWGLQNLQDTIASLGSKSVMGWPQLEGKLPPSPRSLASSRMGGEMEGQNWKKPPWLR